MMTIIHRFILTSLSLLLIGTNLSPTVVQAATLPTETNSPNTQTYKFDSAELPYNIITDKQGHTSKMFWFPNATAHEFTAEETTDSDIFTNSVTGGHPSNDNVFNVVEAMKGLIQDGLTVTSDEHLDQYLLDKKIFPNINTLTDFTQTYKTAIYMYTWLYQAAADKVINHVDFDSAQAHYEATLQKRITALGNLMDANTLATLNGLFSDKTQYDSNLPQLLLFASANYLTSSPEELVNLDPIASEAKAAKLLKTPIETFIHHNPDGKVMADGVLVSYPLLTPITYVFKAPTAPGPGPTPPPSPQQSQPVIVHYLDEQGHSLRPAKTLTGSLGSRYQTQPLNIPSYYLVKTVGQETGIFTTSKQTVTYTYRPNVVAPVVKNSVVYATKGLNLYTTPTFTAGAKMTHFVKKSRMNRPMFKVIDFATSRNGLKRYRVKDLNGKGTTGYITARSTYVKTVYYANKPTKITVINPKGLNAYAKKNLTGKTTHYKQGQVLKVKKIVSHNLTTRFVLSNGTYISANKKLVIAGKYTMPKRAQAKKAVNRYNTADLTKKNRHIAKGTSLKVIGWTYSNVTNFHKGDTLRYKVIGGYITGNSRFVKAID
ncbi:DUF5776 domain-containing protein [Levilactobacillus lanxiensis]|uniref:DUF5776 domain-containing protein n=1 Tax=Levilactobacillus lanxiensis TaxID=2799568 RepID=A0ABW4D455_9LACO|nr:DUF5776 domain-containing protein [Levilactobacillus lanxiensis]